MQRQYECLELSSAECRVKRAGERERERERVTEEERLQRKRDEVSYKAGRRERVSYRRREMKRDKERAEKTRVRLREGESVWGERVGELETKPDWEHAWR